MGSFKSRTHVVPDFKLSFLGLKNKWYPMFNHISNLSFVSILTDIKLGYLIYFVSGY